MKKIAIIVLIILIIFASIFGIYILTYDNTPSQPVADMELQTQLLNNSKWIYLTKEDLNGYLNGTYTSNVQKIISSLEEAIPVIFQTTTKQFGGLENGSFIVASAFDLKNNVYIYYYSPSENIYKKNATSLANILDDSAAAYIYTGTEGL